MDSFVVWKSVSMAWTEVGLDDEDYLKYATDLNLTFRNWKDIDKTIFRDVCASFAKESAMMLFVVIPIIGLLLISPMPDWGYEEEGLRQRMSHWESKPYLLHFINPLRIVGYPIAILFILGLRKKLKKAYHEEKIT